MYFKIPYDFTILRFVFTIRVWFACSVPCQNHDFDNLGVDLSLIFVPYVEFHNSNLNESDWVQKLTFVPITFMKNSFQILSSFGPIFS